ncbi:hypothetical protein HDV57DRAFT_519129 [Trichoderma longibrachiatum]|uniref:Uncharacterized protein n=1 Tax=Trichoderma longibrachiatum ATCC 18648 TaxID=983965 RepID=A0A2T4CBC3_TRILO|nr:hypothetical protein M440DRAFT_1469143 [Trichoderma longibrachiatum ATCC 18648]
MSLPSFVLTPAGHSDALQPAFKTRKLTHGWAVPTSISADPVPSHVEGLSSTIQSTIHSTIQSNLLPLQAADFPMLQQDQPDSCMEPRMMDYAATAEGYLFPVTSQAETASLDAWLQVPNCQPEPSMYQTLSPAHQDLNVFQPLWPSEEVVFGPSNLDSFSAIPYPPAPISASLETIKEDIEQYQLPSAAMPPHEGIPQPTIALTTHTESKKEAPIARGEIIDQVLGALRQMDTTIRAANRQHMADIANSLA